jgi:hypothetical protein
MCLAVLVAVHAFCTAAVLYTLCLTAAAAIFDARAHVRLFFSVEPCEVTAEACPICLERLARPSSRGPCGHAFHAACVAEWLLRAATCPVCRLDLLRPSRRRLHAACADATRHVEAVADAVYGS